MEKPFDCNTIQLEHGDSLYIFSDGFSDQFGGPEKKKYSSTQFKNLLLSHQEKPMEEQFILLNESLQNWQGDVKQLDDICVLGVKV